jgi:hypothetical protein
MSYQLRNGMGDACDPSYTWSDNLHACVGSGGQDALNAALAAANNPVAQAEGRASMASFVVALRQVDLTVPYLQAVLARTDLNSYQRTYAQNQLDALVKERRPYLLRSLAGMTDAVRAQAYIDGNAVALAPVTSDPDLDRVLAALTVAQGQANDAQLHTYDQQQTAIASGATAAIAAGKPYYIGAPPPADFQISNIPAPKPPSSYFAQVAAGSGGSAAGVPAGGIVRASAVGLPSTLFSALPPSLASAAGSIPLWAWLAGGTALLFAASSARGGRH